MGVGWGGGVFGGGGGGGGGQGGSDGQCLWSIFWWRDANEQAGDEKKALEFIVCLEEAGGWRVYRNHDWTSLEVSAMTNMNITYKMPHASTKIDNYLLSMYVCTVQKSRGKCLEVEESKQV